MQMYCSTHYMKKIFSITMQKLVSSTWQTFHDNLESFLISNELMFQWQPLAIYGGEKKALIVQTKFDSIL